MKNFKAYKIIVAVIFAIVLILSSILVVDILSGGESIGKAFGFVVWLVFAIIGFAVPMVMSLIGTILSAIKSKQGLCTIKTLVYFIVFSVLPIIAFFASVRLFKLLINWFLEKNYG